MATKENTKVLVRLLPAHLSSEAFWKLIEDKVSDKVVHWYYVPGKTGPKKYLNSRAYIYFKTHDAVCEFNEHFNGHTFVNSKGVEERALVEYAPYQKLPKLKKRPDLRMGSITEDQDYLSFVEKLKQPAIPIPSAEVQLDKRLAEEKEKIAAAGGVMPAIVTPLMEDIRAKRAARNAPRTILQAPKRRGDRASDKKRANKDDKAKTTEAKANSRDRNSRRRRDRDERKKKKKDKDEPEGQAEEGQIQSQPPAQQQSNSNTEKAPKGSRNGLWMVRNQNSNLEPGSITIQTRGNPAASSKAPVAQSQTTPQASLLPQPTPQPSQPQLQPQVQAPQAGQQPSQGRKPRDNNAERDFSRNRGRRESKKIYTPKQQQPPQQAQPQVQPPSYVVQQAPPAASPVGPYKK